MKALIHIAGSLAFALGLTLAPATVALAQQFPDRVVRLVVSYPPGGGTDVLARIIAPKLSEVLGQSVVIDNRAGAGGTIGSTIVARARADGYTVLIVNTLPHTSAAGLYSKLPYDPIKDFAGVGSIATVPYVLAVYPGVPASNLAELVGIARKGNLNYASAGTGSATHLAAEFFKAETKLRMTHVPYKGGGPALAALIGGEVDLTFENIVAVMGYIKAGKLRGIAVTTPTRSSVLPELPTIAELGYPGFDVGGQFGLVVPGGTTASVIRVLNAALAKAISAPEVQEKLRSQGGEPRTMTAAEFDALMKRESTKWLGVIAQSGLKPE